MRFHEILNQRVAENFSFSTLTNKKVLFLKKGMKCTKSVLFSNQQVAPLRPNFANPQLWENIETKWTLKIQMTSFLLLIYGTHAIIPDGLYIVYSIFHSSLYCRAVYLRREVNSS